MTETSTQLPKFFAIERIVNPLWQKYINWLNKKYQKNYDGDVFNFYGYDKADTAAYDCFSSFSKDTVLITLEHWNKIVNLEDNDFQVDRFPFTLERDQGIRIIGAACPSWGQTLAEKWGVELLTKGSVTVTRDYYLKMRGACTDHQHLLFDEIFGKDNPKDGTPCLVKINGANGYILRFANGNGKFYRLGKKSGEIMRNTLEDWFVLTPESLKNLPVTSE